MKPRSGPATAHSFAKFFALILTLTPHSSPARLSDVTAPIGVIGGTFDPVHYGHLRLAEELGETLKLGEVRLVPSGTPPHRSAPQVGAEHRLAMVRLATAGNPRFKVDEREVHRAGPGYTFDTLTELRAEAGGSRAIVLLLGADAFLEFATWTTGTKFSMATRRSPIVPGSRGTLDERMPHLSRASIGASMQQRWHHLSPAGASPCPFTALDISATPIRDMLRAAHAPLFAPRFGSRLFASMFVKSLYHGKTAMRCHDFGSGAEQARRLDRLTRDLRQSMDQTRASPRGCSQNRRRPERGAGAPVRGCRP